MIKWLWFISTSIPDTPVTVEQNPVVLNFSSQLLCSRVVLCVHVLCSVFTCCALCSRVVLWVYVLCSVFTCCALWSRIVLCVHVLCSVFTCCTAVLNKSLVFSAFTWTFWMSRKNSESWRHDYWKFQMNCMLSTAVQIRRCLYRRVPNFNVYSRCFAV